MEVAALICIIGGGSLTGLLIGFTESIKVEGHKEPRNVILTNMITMTVLMFLVARYFSPNLGEWKTDIAFGILAGAILGAFQSADAGEGTGKRHCIALAGSIPLALIGIRILIENMPFAASAIIVTLVITIALVLV